MVDYSKWSNIEISDDEDETHPNIDTPSLFQWRHQARLDRMEEQKNAIEQANKKEQEHKEKVAEATKKLEEAKKSGSADIETLQELLNELEWEGAKIKQDREKLEQKEKKTPWNVDTICKDGYSKTTINKETPNPKEENLTDEARMEKFVNDYEEKLKQYGMLSGYADSIQFLKTHNYLVCEDTANFLVIWCISLQMEGKFELMAHVAHQTVCIQFILQLGKELQYDPKDFLDRFFSKILDEPSTKLRLTTNYDNL